MLQQAEEQIVTISAEAAQAVQDILTEKNMQGHALRIYVSGSGCSGVQFGMALDDNINDTDTTINTAGIKLIVDNQSLEYARGATIEFVNDPQKGTGFVINSPQSGGGCGCDSESSTNSCGSGGDSCGCGD